MKEQQALASHLLAAFEHETTLAVLCEEARALVALAPQEIVAPVFRSVLGRVLTAPRTRGGARQARPRRPLRARRRGDGPAPLERVVADAALDPARARGPRRSS